MEKESEPLKLALGWKDRIAGELPLPSIMAVPCEGAVTSDHVSEDALVSASVAFNSLAVHVTEVSSLMALVIGSFP